MKLPKRIKTKWLKALRSDKYKQGKGTLYDPTTKTFCCLGVLEHVCLDGKVEHYPLDQHGGMIEICATPSAAFWELIGVKVNEEQEETENALVTMNDGSPFQPRRSFKYIADWIEKNL